MQFYLSCQFFKINLIYSYILRSCNFCFNRDPNYCISWTANQKYKMKYKMKHVFRMTGELEKNQCPWFLLEWIFNVTNITINLSPSSCWGSSPCNKRPWCRLPGCPRYRTPSPRNWPRHVELCVLCCHCTDRRLAEARHCHRSRNPRRANHRRTIACTRSASTACTHLCTARWSPAAASPGEDPDCAGPIPSHPSRSLPPIDQKREDSICEIGRERENRFFRKSREINFRIGTNLCRRKEKICFFLKKNQWRILIWLWFLF